MGTQLSARLAPLLARALPGDLVLLEVATRRQRLRGLAHMDPAGLPRSHGLLLGRCRSVHTAGMRFALDLVWLDREGAVVRVDRGVRRRRLRVCARARAVVETHAGAGEGFAAALSHEPPL